MSQFGRVGILAECLETDDADVAGSGGVAASGTLAKRKAAHLSLRGCDREAA